MNHQDIPSLPAKIATLAEIVAAIEGYRIQLSDFTARTDFNLQLLQSQLQHRIDLARAFQ